MATIKFFSESEEFLQGIESGIEFANDSVLESKGISEDEKYTYVLTVSDREMDDSINKYYNGTSFDYQKTVS